MYFLNANFHPFSVRIVHKLHTLIFSLLLLKLFVCILQFMFLGGRGELLKRPCRYGEEKDKYEHLSFSLKKIRF